MAGTRPYALCILLLLCMCSSLPLEAEDHGGCQCDCSGVDHCSNCCDTCAASEFCCDEWFIRGAALFLDREDPDSAVLLTSAGAPAVNANQFDFDYELGVDVSLGRRFGDGYDFELRYFGIDSWRESLTSAYALPAAVGNTPIVIAGQARFDYASELYNGEFNLGRQYSPNLRVFTGFRMLELNERLDIFIDAGGDSNAIGDANNYLYGWQLGADGSLTNAANPLQINVIGKAGIYHNNAEIRGERYFPPFGALQASAVDEQDVTAFVGELQILGTYPLTNRLAVRGGYQLLFVDGVALASDQLNHIGSLAVGVATADLDRSSVLYQGALLGLEYVW